MLRRVLGRCGSTLNRACCGTDDQACRLDAVREEAKLSKDLMARIPELIEVCPVAIRRLGAMRA